MPTRYRHLRLTHSKDIRAVFRAGARVNAPFLRVIYKKTDLPYPRLCVQVSKKVSKKAVVRNRIRRRTKEAFRMPMAQAQQGVDMVILARRDVADMPWPELAALGERLMAKVVSA